MSQLCLDPGREIFDDQFILVYPWWLQNKTIKSSQGPLKTQFCPFWVSLSEFGKNIIFLLLTAKFNFITYFGDSSPYQDKFSTKIKLRLSRISYKLH